MEDFYCVWNPEHGLPTVKHKTYGIAQTEAERLAKLNPGKQFYVLGTMGVAFQPEPRLFTPSKVNAVEIPF